jgi:hypothetical protein
MRARSWLRGRWCRFEEILEEANLVSEVARRGRDELWGEDIWDVVSVQA